MFPTSGSFAWTLVAAVSSHRTTTSLTRRRDWATRATSASVSAASVVHFWTPSHGETCRTAEATRGHYGRVHAVPGGVLLADPAITTEPRGLTDTQSRPVDLFTTGAVPGRSAALDVCVASSSAAAARGDVAQAASDRNTTHYRREIPDLRAQGKVYRPLVWTADGRPHRAVTRTLQYAAATAACRNGQQMSAKALQHCWKQKKTNCTSPTQGSHDTSSPHQHTSKRTMVTRRAVRQSPWSLGSCTPT